MYHTNNKIFIFISLIGLWLFASCNTDKPKEFKTLDETPEIFPDYSGLTIPSNIAPLNFEIQNDGEQFITMVYGVNSEPLTIKGKEVSISEKKWREILSDNKGKSLYYDIYVKKNGKWDQYKTIKNTISDDEIDHYIAYRLIPPGYVIYRYLSIIQRDLTSFKEKVIYENALVQTKQEGQCINCHSFQNYNKNNHFQMHIRGFHGGTLIESNGSFKKVNLKTDSLISGGVYPAWHPTQNLVAYSVNNIGQMFHTKSQEKIEVLDKLSDIIVYDVDKNEVKFVANDKDQLETFPYWTPSGDALMYSSAYFKHKTDNLDANVNSVYTNINYNIFRIDYDIATGKFGKTDTLYNAEKIGKSATYPRVSPDGEYLLFTMADYGNFHIWHKSADLYLLNMKTGYARNCREINSSDVESYHSWSSNGKWVIFSSRRIDGSYTRFYLSHFDDKGHFSKPFILPQEDPNYYHQFLKSYNIPEFLVEPVDFNARDLVPYIKEDVEQVSFGH